jgi:hypothetical protein
VHRVKRGHDAKHPLRGPQLRLLRELQRLYPDSPYVFVSERKALLSPRSIRAIITRAESYINTLLLQHHPCHLCYDRCAHEHEGSAKSGEERGWIF